jgi:hypothetical protein
MKFKGSRLSWVVVGLLGTGALGLAGCVPVATWVDYAVTDHGPSASEIELLKEETAPYRHRGTAAITGQVLVRTASGQVFSGAGRPVHLIPATEWARKQFAKRVIEQGKLPDRYEQEVWWVGKADDAGRFHFGWLPAGDYLVFSEIAWASSQGGAQTTVAYAEVLLAAGQHAKDVAVQREVAG